MATIIRTAQLEDLPRITEIYNYYILNTAYTFDLSTFEPHERERWFNKYAESGPHRLIVATDGGRIVGYASSGLFREKPAYHTSVEVTVYVCHKHGTRGIGSMLYQHLFSVLEREDVNRAYAGITQPNTASVKLHEKFGFKSVAIFSDVGRKFDRYWNVEWFVKRMS